MNSYTNVLKPRDQQEASAWSPSELRTALPSARNQAGMEPGTTRETIPMEGETTAAELIAAAERKAEQIREAALREAEALKEQARMKGLTEGRAGIEQEVLDAAAAARSIVEQASEWQSQFIGSGEQQIIGLVTVIAEKLFGNGYELDQPELQQMLSRVFQRARSLGNLRCFLNPRDQEILNREWVEKQQAFHGVNIVLVPDETIQAGGCHIEGLYGSVDARIENRLESIIDALKQVEAREHSEPGEAP